MIYIDISATVGTNHRYVDVTIIYPAVQEYLPGSAAEGGVASVTTEVNKRSKYLSTLAARGIAETAAVPASHERNKEATITINHLLSFWSSRSIQRPCITHGRTFH
jgi:hypothetical protein